MALIPLNQEEVWRLRKGVVSQVNTYTTVGGAASEVIAVPGLRSGDTVVATLADNGTSNVLLVTAQVTANDELTLTFSADPGSDTIVSIVAVTALSTPS